MTHKCQQQTEQMLSACICNKNKPTTVIITNVEDLQRVQ